MFTFMLLILLYIFSQFFAIVGLMNLDIANINMPIPITIYEVRQIMHVSLVPQERFLPTHNFFLSDFCSWFSNILRF